MTKKLLLLFALFSLSCQALEINGTWQQGAMLIGKVEPGVEVFFNGSELATTATGQFVFGLDRNAPEVATIELRSDGKTNQHHFRVKQRSYTIQRVDGVPQATVTPPPEVLERIAAEASLVKKARSTLTHRQDFLSAFQRPLEGRITGVYGSQRIYNGEPKNPHFGLDIAGPEGALVTAPAPGVVTLVHDDMFYSGGTLIVDHGFGVSSTFIHLSAILVKVGDRVEQGEAIARVGSTGRATGPHLDWRMNWRNVRIDPALVLDSFGVVENGEGTDQ